MRSHAALYPAGQGEREHSHNGWHQLVYAASGFFGVHTPGASWVVPAGRGVWIPQSTPHHLTTRSRSLLHTLYIRDDVHNHVAGLPIFAAAATVVRVTPLVRELIALIIQRGLLRSDEDRDRYVLAVLVEQLVALPASPLDLPEPRSARARRAAEQLRADPSTNLNDVARKVGVSRRTLERDFAVAGGLALGCWRRRAIMLRAIEMLAEGCSVTAVGASLGFSTTSAFISAFKEELDVSPGRYFKDA